MANARNFVFVAWILGAKACTVGSRSGCGNGVCVADGFFDNNPFFNKCECDFCYAGAGSCDSNTCIVWMVPLGMCLCCVSCVLGCVCGYIRSAVKANFEALADAAAAAQAEVARPPAGPPVVVEAKVVDATVMGANVA